MSSTAEVLPHTKFDGMFSEKPVCGVKFSPI